MRGDRVGATDRRMVARAGARAGEGAIRGVLAEDGGSRNGRGRRRNEVGRGIADGSGPQSDRPGLLDILSSLYTIWPLEAALTILYVQTIVLIF